MKKTSSFLLSAISAMILATVLLTGTPALAGGNGLSGAGRWGGGWLGGDKYKAGAAPEIDPAGLSAIATLVVGGLAIARGRRR